MKKTISLLLALCMLISLLPATVLFVGAEDAVRDGTISYDFTYASRNQTGRVKVENKNTILASFATYPKDQATPDTDAKDQWIYLGMNGNYSGTASGNPWVRIDGNGYLLTNNGNNIWPSKADGTETVGEGWMAFQIYVPTVGTYDLSMYVEALSTASESVDIYLGKTSTWNQTYFSSTDVIGTRTTLTASTDKNPYTNTTCTAATNVIREGAKKFSELGLPQSYLKASGISLKYDAATAIDLTGKLVVDEPGDYLFLIRNRETDSRLILSALTLTPVEGSIPDTTQDTTFVFDALSAHGYTSNKLETRTGVPEGSCTKYPENPSNPGYMWAYLGTNVPSSGTKSSAYFSLVNNAADGPYYVLTGLLPYDGWLALKLYVPASGTYSVSGTAWGRVDTSKEQEMYLLPADAELTGGKSAEETFARPKDGGVYGTVALNEAGDKYVRTGASEFSDLGIDNKYLISTSDISADESVEVNMETARGIELKKGEYILLLREADDTVTSAAKRLSIASLTLSPMVVISTDTAAVVDETTPKLSAKVYGIDGMLVPDAEVTYTTTDTDVISIDGDIITPIDRGTATITAKATVGGKVIYSEYTISVSVPAVGKFTQVGVSLDGEFSVPAYATRRVDVTLQDKYGTVIEEFTETPIVRVWYENGDTAVDGIEENGEWYITAPADVESIKLCAEVTYKDDTVTGSSDIEVVNTDNDKHVIIDFMNQPITDAYSATLEEHGWRLVSWDISSKGTIALNLNGLTVTPRKTGKGVIEVNIPRSGYYSISVAGRANGIRSAEDVDIYLDGVYAGDYGFYKNGTSQNILPETFRTFYIEAGTHTLTFDCQPRSLQVVSPVTGELEYVNEARYGQPYSSIAFFAEDGMPGIKELTAAKESYEINKGESTKLSASLLFENGVSHELMPSLDGARQDYSIEYELIDGGEYIDLAEDGIVTAKEVGNAHVKMTVTDNTGESRGQTWTKTVEVTVKDYSLLGGIEITADSFVMRPGERESIALDIKAVTLGGEDFIGDVSWDDVSWTYDENEENVSFSVNDGVLSASIGGDAEEGAYPVSAIAILDGVPYEAKATVTVTYGKAGRTYYTDERVATALENINKYTWAKKEKEAAVDAADKYVALGMEGMWNLLIGEGIPRSIRISRRGDKLTNYICRYCGKQVATSGYPWITSPLTRPWKIQCPECKRLFPSNDFGSLYELGRGNDGVYDRFLALERHHNMIYHPAEFSENRDYECECEKPEMMDPTGTTALFSEYGAEITNWYKYYGYGQGYLKNTTYTELYTDGQEFNGIDPFRYNGDLDEDGKADCEVYNLVGGYDDVKSGMLWCVDDGWGYAPGNAMVSAATVSDVWPFIAHYAHNGFWFAGSNTAMDALESLRLAYIYTGDEKYGEIGAVMIDRIADLYPEYSSTDWVDSTGTKRNWNSLRYAFSDSSFNTGKISNDIWDTNFATEFALCYDAFWPMYDDPEVQKFLAEKEAEYPGVGVHPVTGEARLSKNSNKNIRDNIERDLIYEIYEAVLAHDINGNFGSHQQSLAIAAVVYDREPATREMIDWLFAESKTNSSTAGSTFNTGGELLQKIVNEVSRDGQGTESSSSYNYGWIENTVGAATALGLYTGEITEKENLWRNPKYITMLTCYNDMLDLHRGTQSIGDQGIMGSYRVMPSDTNIIAEGYKQIGTYVKELEESLQDADDGDKAEIQEKIDGYRSVKTEFAQLMYEIAVKGKNFALEDLHYDIFTKDPESLYDDLEAEIEAYGEYDYDKSSMMTGYGFASLRSGALYNNVSGTNTIKDTTRDFWMYFGGALSHSHRDFLNIGIDAYGMSISSDNGYPEQTGSYPSRHQWTNVTLSHNTVVINETSSIKPEDPAKPLHFDNKDTRVRLMDVDGSATYQTADDYRRTVMMIDYDDEISYGVDFFKVLGGEDHIYSFHASSNTVTATTGLDSIEHQVDDNGNYIGTYASPEARFGNDPWTNPSSQYVPLMYPSGYTWLEKIRKDTEPDMNFSVDYKISDLQKISRNPSGLMDVHLKVTTANDWTADEVTLAQSVPSRRDGWDKVINRIEYLLIRRKAEADEKLDTLYTTVFQPYNKTPYIKSIDRIEMVPANGESLGTDKAAAVRVELIDGRIDYVMYSSRNDILYTVTDTTAGTETEGYSFPFEGFAGVWTVKTVDGTIENVYSYLCDGTVIGEDTTEYTDALTGKVTWHTKGLSIVNKAEVEFDEPISKELLAKLREDETSLSGRIFVGETTAPGNAAFIIDDAEISEDGKTAMLNFGNITLVDSYASYEDDTYNYYLTEGKTRFSIPMSYEEDNAPEFDEISNVSASAESSLKVTVKAESQLDDGVITYSARTLPRGAGFNAATGVFTWKPDGSQVGENLVAIDATDSLGRTSTLYFTVTVYGSTTGSASDKNNNESTGNSGDSGDSATSAGGGGGTSGQETTDTKPEGSASENTDTSDKTDNGASSGEGGNVRFIDLGNHSWAADSINALANDGIVKGTTHNTYSPAANITRADFALLLVRAFNLTSDNTENFADISASDYFAQELAVARNTGIVNGIGDNKYAPRNPITRQDMMVIVYRALQNLDNEPPFSRGRGTVEDGGGIQAPAEDAATNNEQKPSPVGEGGAATAVTDEALLSERYGDWDSVAPYARDAVSHLIANGIVNGKNGRIAPTDYTTRAEVAVLLKRILEYTK